MRMQNLALDGAKRHRAKFGAVVLGGVVVGVAVLEFAFILGCFGKC